jgi:hypothetical protein
MLSSSSMGTSCKGRKRHSGSVGKLHTGEHFDWFSESTSFNLASQVPSPMEIHHDRSFNLSLELETIEDLKSETTGN